MEETKHEAPIEPRFEFRSFGQNFDQAASRMARLSVPVPEELWERNSEEMYIVSSTNDIHNIKIRAQKIDIKAFIRIVDGLEQWMPILEYDFPLKASLLSKEVFPAMLVNAPQLDKESYTLDEFMDLVRMHPELKVISVHKQRFGYMVHDTICETGIILVNGARVMTISIESTNPENVQRTIHDIRLEGVENINYLQMIKRVIGMIHKPLAN